MSMIEIWGATTGFHGQARSLKGTVLRQGVPPVLTLSRDTSATIWMDRSFIVFTTPKASL
jgi:hypothetical protein